MAEFSADFHSLMDATTMEFAAQFPGLNSRLFDRSMSFRGYFSLSNDMFCAHQSPEDPGNSQEIFPECNQIAQPILSTENESNETRKRRAIDELHATSAISTPQASENGIKRKESSGRGKRVKSKEREEKTGEIILVRARRGQATDSHSLAERARRGKINERLRCLQDIVPGCYKSMGMAVMLDEIINYVQSLQNQVEFLSMKLATASWFNDFNSQSFASENILVPLTDRLTKYNDLRPGGEEAKEMGRLIREGSATPSCFHSSWPF